MKRTVVISGVLLCLLAGLFGAGLVQARERPFGIPAQEFPQPLNTISVLDSTAVVDFPVKLTFSISVADNVDLTDIRLRYTVDRESFARVYSEAFLEFNSATVVETSWTLDMQKTGGLPPGTTLNYWWVIKDAAGNVLETTPKQVDFNDNRYRWYDIKQDMITLYWYNGNDTFASELMATATAALYRLETNTGARLIRPVKIYIYASTTALRGAMIFPAEWTGGVTFAEYAIIAIGIAPSNMDWGKTAIAHELTHLIVHQMILNPYNQLPTWLDEGLAVYNEGQPPLAFASILSQAIANDQLVSLRSLSSPFSAHTSEATLSYAESYSVVNYLITTYGQADMLSLLNTFQKGSTYDDAFMKVYGLDMDGLYALWKQRVTPQTGITTEGVLMLPSIKLAFPAGGGGGQR